jgi:hypothetical protein
MTDLNCPNCNSDDTQRTFNLREFKCVDCGTCYQYNELNETRIFVEGDYDTFVNNTIDKITENVKDPSIKSAIKQGSLGFINEGSQALPDLVRHLMYEAEILCDQYEAGFRDEYDFVSVMEGIKKLLSYGAIHESEYPELEAEFESLMPDKTFGGIKTFDGPKKLGKGSQKKLSRHDDDEVDAELSKVAKLGKPKTSTGIGGTAPMAGVYEDDDEVEDDFEDEIEDEVTVIDPEDEMVPPEGDTNTDLQVAVDQIQDAANDISSAAADIVDATGTDDAEIAGPGILGVSSVGGEEVNGIPTDYGDDYNMIPNPFLPSGATEVEVDAETGINDPYGEMEDEVEDELETALGGIVNENYAFKVGDKVYVENIKKTCVIKSIQESVVIVEDEDGNLSEIDVEPDDLEEQEAITFSQEEDPDVVAERYEASSQTLKDKWASMAEDFENNADSSLLGVNEFDEGQDISEYQEEVVEEDFDPYHFNEVDENEFVSESVETAESDSDGISKSKVFDGMGGGVEDNDGKAASSKKDKDGNVTKTVETAEDESDGIDYPEDGLGGGVEETKES